MARKKIALVGAGQIGGTMALVLAQKQLGDVILIDIPQAGGMPAGKALDIMEGRALINTSCILEGSTDYADIKGADVVIVTRLPYVKSWDFTARNDAMLEGERAAQAALVAIKQKMGR